MSQLFANNPRTTVYYWPFDYFDVVHWPRHYVMQIMIILKSISTPTVIIICLLGHNLKLHALSDWSLTRCVESNRICTYRVRLSFIFGLINYMYYMIYLSFWTGINILYDAFTTLLFHVQIQCTMTRFLYRVCIMKCTVLCYQLKDNKLLGLCPLQK